MRPCALASAALLRWTWRTHEKKYLKNQGYTPIARQYILLPVCHRPSLPSLRPLAFPPSFLCLRFRGCGPGTLPWARVGRVFRAGFFGLSWRTHEARMHASSAGHHQAERAHEPWAQCARLGERPPCLHEGLNFSLRSPALASVPGRPASWSMEVGPCRIIVCLRRDGRGCVTTGLPGCATLKIASVRPTRDLPHPTSLARGLTPDAWAWAPGLLTS